MGTTPSKNHRLTLPDDSEPVKVKQLTDNFSILDKAVPLWTVADKPADKAIKIFAGNVFMDKGAGGENATASPATDGQGYGAVFLGQRGVPTFEGFSYVSISDAGNSANLMLQISIMDVDTKRIKFRAKKQDAGTWGVNYAGLRVFLMIVGW